MLSSNLPYIFFARIRIIELTCCLGKTVNLATEEISINFAFGGYIDFIVKTYVPSDSMYHDVILLLWKHYFLGNQRNVCNSFAV